MRGAVRNRMRAPQSAFCTVTGIVKNKRERKTHAVAFCMFCAAQNAKHFNFLLPPSLDLLGKFAVPAPIKGNRGFASDKGCWRTRSPRRRTRGGNARAVYIRLAIVNSWSSLWSRRHDQVLGGLVSGSTCGDVAIRERIWRTQRAVTSIEAITVSVERVAAQVSIMAFRAHQGHSWRRRHGLVGRACHAFAVCGW